MKSLRYKAEAGIAWLTLDNPPLNALSHALRQAVIDGLERAQSDAKVRVVVIQGNERAFSSGADIKEFAGGNFYADPFLPALVDAIETARKPVIAATTETSRGGGIEPHLS